MTRRLLSCRKSKLTLSRALTFEFEDVIAKCDERVQIDTTAVPSKSLRRRVWRARRAAELIVDPRKKDGADELAFAVAQVPGDLVDLLGFGSTIQSAAKAAVYIEEIWTRHIPLPVDLRALLREFDHVFLGCAGTAGPLSEHLDTPCSHLPPSVDLDRFTTSPWPPSVIDVYAMGRRRPALHEALLKWSNADRSRFYLYDTFGGNVPIPDHRAHRDKLADLIRRSRYFLVDEAKLNRPQETGKQSEVGYRFFEGAAAGAVMIGPELHSKNFGKLFDWEEPVVFVDPSGADIADRIDALDADSERRRAIRRRNAAGSLHAHDPAHRWRTVLETLGLEVPSGVRNRIHRLAERADALDLSDTR